MRNGQRRLAIVAVCAAVWCATAPAAAQFATGMVPQHVAQRVGLERAWFARVQVNPFRSAVVRWILSRDHLFVLTNAGVVHAIDANTGQTLWITPVGNPDYPSLGPGANDSLVGLVNGSTLYLLDRASGRIVSERRLGGAPGAGPALGKQFVFTPLISGRMEGYALDESAERSWFYQSFGRALAPPLATPESIIWGTTAGYLYVGRVDEPGIRYRLQTFGEFLTQPAYRPPLVFATTLDGETFAIDERKGELRWKYVTGYPTERAPAVVADRVYVSTEEPMLHAIDADTGLGRWEAPDISQFAAAGPSRVYGVDRFGTIHIVDRSTGASVGRILTGGTLTALVNDQTDRLYLISNTGLVQCLHEIGADAPTYYYDRPAEESPTAPGEPAYRGDGEPATTPSRPSDESRPLPPAEDDPFAAPAAESDFDDPFAEEPTPPADAGFDADDNPFE